MVITKSFDWKTFKIELNDLHGWLWSNAHGKYAGMSADSKLHLHFTSALTEQEEAAIEQYWNALTKETEEAKVAHRDALERAVKYATDNLPYADFASLIAAEKKIWMRQPLTLQDKENLLAKYPNV